jgi:hypothetical protein
MRFINKTIFTEKTTATNPTKIIHRITITVGPRVPHTIIITVIPTVINLAPRPHIIPPFSYSTNSREKIVS